MLSNAARELRLTTIGTIDLHLALGFPGTQIGFFADSLSLSSHLAILFPLRIRDSRNIKTIGGTAID